ncbi:hypothetical protein D3P96_01945 [Weissella viridescens]|uniref:Uncharacterized protein n=1 Tax=Weissella viridescens TaxID=1629 RepID=A0A3P2RDD5_WEIVI|nr:hypothetical protein [Weissella viridescens]RRG18769.1 hypothetical protein D3P96_01945 [Weissella viridescens]
MATMRDGLKENREAAQDATDKKIDEALEDATKSKATDADEKYYKHEEEHYSKEDWVNEKKDEEGER